MRVGSTDVTPDGIRLRADRCRDRERLGRCYLVRWSLRKYRRGRRFREYIQFRFRLEQQLLCLVGIVHGRN